MSASTPASRVHYYDTHVRRIACGVRGADNRSSKHPHSVTCDACLGLLGTGATPGADDAGAASSGVPD